MDKRIAAFHQLYYEQSAYWNETRWLGVPCIKSPLDLWVYQEIIHETRPTLILETGTDRGGSALFLASILDLVGAGRVISIDTNPVSDAYPDHPRISYRSGNSVDPAVVAEMESAAKGERTMVILDSDHSYEHVAAELAAYAPLVSSGCYLIVEDTCIGGRPLRLDLQRGPAEAVAAFLAGSADFEVEREREKFLMTFNPGGFLRCISL